MTARSAKDPPLDRLLTGGTYVLGGVTSLAAFATGEEMKTIVGGEAGKSRPDPGLGEILNRRYRGGVRRETGTALKYTTQVKITFYEWRWGRSPANPFSPNSLFNRELSGK